MSEDKTLEVLSDFANALEAISVKLKRDTAAIAQKNICEKPITTAIPETTFTILKFEAQKGEKLGDYETADKKNNAADHFQHAYNILKVNNATISARFHLEGYTFSYWNYNDRIFRQKLKE